MQAFPPSARRTGSWPNTGSRSGTSTSRSSPGTLTTRTGRCHPGRTWRSLRRDGDPRKVARDLTIRFRNRYWQIPEREARDIRSGTEVVECRLNGDLHFRPGPRYLAAEPLGRDRPALRPPESPPPKPRKPARKPPKPKPDHPWRKRTAPKPGWPRRGGTDASLERLPGPTGRSRGPAMRFLRKSREWLGSTALEGGSGAPHGSGRTGGSRSPHPSPLRLAGMGKTHPGGHL